VEISEGVFIPSIDHCNAKGIKNTYAKTMRFYQFVGIDVGKPFTLHYEIVDINLYQI
jgi:hypothetical protein